jgi:hypothetical protein
LPVPSAAQEPWEFYFTPYLWATDINARISPQRLPSSHRLNVDFSKIISNLDGVPIIGAGELRSGRIGLIGDLIYLPVSSRIDTRNVLFNDGKSKFTTLMWEVVGLYRVSEDAAIKADVGGGYRLWSVSSKARLNAGLLPAASAKFDKTFIDPILAVRVNIALSDRWSVTGYGDAGGFDITSSKLTWQIFGTVNYRAADWVEVRAGWRYIAVERNDLNVELNGPIVGATFRF